MIRIVDTGLGNLRSVERAVRLASSDEVSITSDPDAVRAADVIVVPGQGGFGECARSLQFGLGVAIREKILAGTPYLGICLGLQVLFERSDEAPGSAGLGIFAGHVRRIDPGPSEKVPHMGWNTVEGSIGAGFYYFVHSFVVVAEDESIVAATTQHGRDRFASAIEKDNVFAVQFHPEKSQRAGINLLQRFFARCSPRT